MLKKIFQKNLSVNSNQPSFNKKNLYYEPVKIGKRTRYYLGKPYPGVYFTPQEARCMYYFLNKFTDKKVAKIMKIRPRTVTYYSFNMQCKILTRSKKEMITKIRKSEFMQYLKSLRILC